jgi:hypothetical protein
MIEILIEIKETDEVLKNILIKSFLVENVDKKFVNIGEPFLLSIKAQRLSRARAIMNSYMLQLYSILSTLKEVEKNDGTNSA